MPRLESIDLILGLRKDLLADALSAGHARGVEAMR
jgi:hypothetical protein